MCSLKKNQSVQEAINTLKINKVVVKSLCTYLWASTPLYPWNKLEVKLLWQKDQIILYKYFNLHSFQQHKVSILQNSC